QRLDGFFGPIHLWFYTQAAQNALRGYAARFDAEASGTRWAREYLDPGGYRDLRLLLLTGEDNTLWHRDGIDRMYDWVRRVSRAAKRCGERPGGPGLRDARQLGSAGHSR